jgi:bacterial/archaeal transporter family protein
MRRPAVPVHGASRNRGVSVLRWLVPAVGCMLSIGLLGLTTKIALEDLTWQQVVLWTSAVYAVIAVLLLLTRGVPRRRAPVNRLAGLTGIMIPTALIMLFLALDAGEVSRVVPVTSAYPVVTAVLAAAFLSERVDLPRMGAILLVVMGVILLSI